MKTNNQTVSVETILNITLVEFRENPFCPSYIIDALTSMGYNTLADLIDITREKAQSFWGFGRGKVDKLMSFVYKLRFGNLEDIAAFYESDIRITTLPSSETAESPLHAKIHDVLSGLCTILENHGKDELAIVCREGFLNNKTLATVHRENAHRLHITRERVRQQMIWLRDAIWRDGLVKYRIEIDESFIDELSLAKAACMDQPLSRLVSLLGDGAPAHVYSNLFGFDVVSSEKKIHGAIDQNYLTSSESGIITFSRDLSAIISELHREVRPMSFEQICQRVAATRAGVPETRIRAILTNHSDIEKLEDGRYQIRYAALCDYERVARLVWEKQRISHDEIDLQNTLRTGECSLISHNINVAAGKFRWCRPLGRKGIWVYDEGQTPGRKSVRTFIKEYVENHDVFRFSDAIVAVRSAGYIYPEKTLRAYFTNLCREANADKDILCEVEKTRLHPDISWRRKKSDISDYRITGIAVRYILSHGPATRPEILNEIMRLDTEGEYTRKCAWQALTTRVNRNDVLHMRYDGRISVNSAYVRNGVFDEEKLRHESLPEHYHAVLAVLKAKLEQSPDKTCSLSSLRKACGQILRPFCKPTIFYKIIDKVCPAGIEKVMIGNNMYLHQTA